MKLKDIIEKLESCAVFSDWRKKNKDCYLAHAFMMMDKENENLWQIGYYNPKSDKVTTFMVEGDDFKACPETEIFKKPGAKVDKLDVNKVVIGSVQAVETAEGVMEKEYPKALPLKMFFIIQNLPEHGNVYNLTFVTQDFKTINIRISTETGKVLFHGIRDVFQFKK